MTGREHRRKTSIKGKKNLRFRCQGCGRCCRLWITLTHCDVQRIMAATGAPAEKIVQFVPRKKVLRQPGGLIWIKFGKRKKDKKLMAVREKNDRCRFLKKKRCVIYESRPLVCWEHPFVLTLDDHGRIRRIALYDACKCKGTLDGKNAPADLAAVHRWAQYEENAYQKKVDAWNRRKKPGTHQQFLEYLGLAESQEN